MRKRDTFDKEHDDRNSDTKDVMGDLMISQYQTERIRARLAGKVEGYRHAAAGYYYKEDDVESSTYQFQHKGKLYRVSVRVDMMPSHLKRIRFGQFVESLSTDAIPGSRKKK